MTRDALYAINADGSGKRRLAGRGGGPVWSPDGRRIAFIRRFSSRKFEIYVAGPSEINVVNADGTGLRRLARDAENGSDVSWSPAGRQIAFSKAVDGNWEIYVVNADGSGLRRLTRNPSVGGESGLVAGRADHRLRQQSNERRQR